MGTQTKCSYPFQLHLRISYILAMSRRLIDIRRRTKIRTQRYHALIALIPLLKVSKRVITLVITLVTITFVRLELTKTQAGQLMNRNARAHPKTSPQHLSSIMVLVRGSTNKLEKTLPTRNLREP